MEGRIKFERTLSITDGLNSKGLVCALSYVDRTKNGIVMGRIVRICQLHQMGNNCKHRSIQMIYLEELLARPGESPMEFRCVLYNEVAESMSSLNLPLNSIMAVRKPLIMKSSVMPYNTPLHKSQIVCGMYYSNLSDDVFIRRKKHWSTLVSLVSETSPYEQNYVTENVANMYRYAKIIELMETTCNIYGIIDKIELVESETLADNINHHFYIRVVDEQLLPLSVHVYCQMDQNLPMLQERYIIRFHRLKVKNSGNQMHGIISNLNDVVIFDPNNEDVTYSTAKEINYTDEDQRRLTQLKQFLLDGYVICRQLKTLELEMALFRLRCKVVVIKDIGESKMMLRVSDGTKTRVPCVSIPLIDYCDVKADSKKNTDEIDITVFNPHKAFKTLVEGDYIQLNRIESRVLSKPVKKKGLQFSLNGQKRDLIILSKRDQHDSLDAKDNRENDVIESTSNCCSTDLQSRKELLRKIEAESSQSESEIKLLTSVIVGLREKNKDLTSVIVGLRENNKHLAARMNYLETRIENEIPKKTRRTKIITPPLFCKICDMFDLHDTDDCPKQFDNKSDPPVTTAVPNDELRKLPEGPESDICEVNQKLDLIAEESFKNIK